MDNRRESCHKDSASPNFYFPSNDDDAENDLRNTCSTKRVKQFLAKLFDWLSRVNQSHILHRYPTKQKVVLDDTKR